MSFLVRLVLVFVLSFAVGSAARAQPTYPLTCQGGPTMRITVRSWQESSEVRIEFARAARAASEAHPLGGECAWADRALGSDEPTVAVATFEGVSVQTTVFGDGRLERFRYGGEHVENLEQVSELLGRILQSQSFEIFVRAVGSGSARRFEIARVRH